MSPATWSRGTRYASDPAAPKPAELLRAAAERIEIVIPNLASQPDIVDAAAREAPPTAAASASSSRTQTDRSNRCSASTRSRSAPRPPARTTSSTEPTTRCSSRSHASASAAQSPPMIHLPAQRQYGGLFDRLADDFEDRWDKATPLASREQLHAYLAETELEPWPEPDQLPEPDPPSPRRAIAAIARLRPPRPETAAPLARTTDLTRAPVAAQPSAGAPCHEVGAIVARAAGPSRSGPSRLLGLPTARGPSPDCPSVTRSAPPKS